MAQISSLRLRSLDEDPYDGGFKGDQTVVSLSRRFCTNYAMKIANGQLHCRC